MNLDLQKNKITKNSVRFGIEYATAYICNRICNRLPFSTVTSGFITLINFNKTILYAVARKLLKIIWRMLLNVLRATFFHSFSNLYSAFPWAIMWFFLNSSNSFKNMYVPINPLRHNLWLCFEGENGLVLAEKNYLANGTWNYNVTKPRCSETTWRRTEVQAQTVRCSCF